MPTVTKKEFVCVIDVEKGQIGKPIASWFLHMYIYDGEGG